MGVAPAAALARGSGGRRRHLGIRWKTRQRASPGTRGWGAAGMSRTSACRVARTEMPEPPPWEPGAGSGGRRAVFAPGPRAAQSGPVRRERTRGLLAGGEAPERRREAVAGAGCSQACHCRVARRGAVAAPARAARPRKCSPLPCERRGTFFLGCRGPLARSTRLSHRVDPPRF